MLTEDTKKIKYHVFNEKEIPVSGGKRIQIKELEIAVIKQTNGTIKAIENRCPHKGGLLSEGIISGNYVFCPLHDWKIDLNDGEAQAPDKGCVATYKTEVIEEEVYIWI